ASALHGHRACPRLAIDPQRVSAGAQAVEHGGEFGCAARAPLEYLLVAAALVRAGLADLDLDAVHGWIGAQDQGAEVAADVQHDELGMPARRVVLGMVGM